MTLKKLLNCKRIQQFNEINKKIHELSEKLNKDITERNKTEILELEEFSEWNKKKNTIESLSNRLEQAE